MYEKYAKSQSEHMKKGQKTTHERMKNVQNH